MRPTAVYALIVLLAALVLGQGLAWVLNPAGYGLFWHTLPVILSQVAFWGPIIALIEAGFVLMTLRLLGFRSLEVIRRETVEENNPAPAVVLVGTLIASLLFLLLIIRP